MIGNNKWKQKKTETIFLKKNLHKKDNVDTRLIK